MLVRTGIHLWVPAIWKQEVITWFAVSARVVVDSLVAR
jgi:hypothetical protein